MRVALPAGAAVVRRRRARLRAEAIGAVDGPIAAWLERYARLPATASAGRREELAARRASCAVAWRSGRCVLPGALRATRGATARAPTRLVGEAFRGVELLFARGEDELGSTIDAGEGFVDEWHATASGKRSLTGNSALRSGPEAS